jgi:hypothetical protein
MRPPRPGVSWSRGRVVRRACYADWMTGPCWQRSRARWHAARLSRYGGEPTCAACGAEWTLRAGDLHHRCYERLGHERFDDLVALCRGCHESLHLILESMPAWRRMSRSQATHLIIAALARRPSSTVAAVDE